MRFTSLALLFLLVSANSCNKELKAEKQIKTQITGRWELSFYSCGECMIPMITYPPGNGNTIEFAEDGSFVRKLIDSVIFDGRYAIVTSKECDKSGHLALQTNETAYGTLRFITLEDETLTLSTPDCYMDGAATIYKRIH